MTNINGLRGLIKSSLIAKAFFDQLKTRVKNYRITTVDQAMRATEGERRDVIEMFRHMEQLELGSFVLGRRTGVSRFEWSVGMVETAQAAFGELDDIEPLERSELDLELEETHHEDGDEELEIHLTHSFVLRRNVSPVTFNLPADLNHHEAERLSKFILTLPIRDESTNPH